jgi:hypothetical protein
VPANLPQGGAQNVEGRDHAAKLSLSRRSG